MAAQKWNGLSRCRTRSAHSIRPSQCPTGAVAQRQKPGCGATTGSSNPRRPKSPRNRFAKAAVGSIFELGPAPKRKTRPHGSFEPTEGHLLPSTVMIFAPMPDTTLQKSMRNG